MSLRRGRPRYRVGYVAEVLQFLAYKYHRNHYRPVHVANSIACLELRMSKTSWLRIVRVLEAAGWITRTARPGGRENKGALYVMLPPPNGRHPGRLPSPIEPDTNRIRVPSNGHSEAPLSDPELASLIRGDSHPNLAEGTLNRLRTYLNGPDSNTVKVLDIPSSGPLIRIAEGILGVPTPLIEGQRATALDKEPSATAAGDPLPPSRQESVADPPHSPSHRRETSAGRDVRVRYSDGTETVIRSSVPDEETLATIRAILDTPSYGPRARRYLEAVARLEAKERS